MITVVTATNFNMTAFPNPFKDHTMIIFSVEQDAYTTIELYDLSGKLVQRLFNAEAQAGMQYAINVDGSEWNSGVYLCRITSNNQIEHVRLVLAS
jgi:Tol biopolymer transport system component